MASKSRKVLPTCKVPLITLGDKLKICGISVSWWKEEYLLDCFVQFRLSTQGLFEELCRQAKGACHKNVLIVGLVWSWLSMFFFNVHHVSRKN